jgi:hypothetical protein
MYFRMTRFCQNKKAASRVFGDCAEALRLWILETTDAVEVLGEHLRDGEYIHIAMHRSEASARTSLPQVWELYQSMSDIIDLNSIQVHFGRSPHDEMPAEFKISAHLH